MRSILISLFVSVVATIFLWSLGLGRLAWSRQHPVTAMFIFAVLCAVLVQLAIKHFADSGSKPR